MGILDLKNTVTEKESTEKNDCRDFPSEILEDRRKWNYIFKVLGDDRWGKAGYQLRFYIQQKYSS